MAEENNKLAALNLIYMVEGFGNADFILNADYERNKVHFIDLGEGEKKSLSNLMSDNPAFIRLAIKQLPEDFDQKPESYYVDVKGMAFKVLSNGNEIKMDKDEYKLMIPECLRHYVKY